METVIVAAVVIIAVLAHVALYRWVRFKIHEGIIIQFLRDAAENGAADSSAAAIAAHTDLPLKRVQAVCTRSNAVCADASTPDNWRTH